MGNLSDSTPLSPDKSDIAKGHNKVLAHLPVSQPDGISRSSYRVPAIEVVVCVEPGALVVVKTPTAAGIIRSPKE